MKKHTVTVAEQQASMARGLEANGLSPAKFAHRRRVLEFQGEQIELQTIPKVDLINSPPHYANFKIECIDAIESALGRDGFIAFLKGQVMKYTWRAGHKDDAVADISKGEWYMARLRATLSA